MTWLWVPLALVPNVVAFVLLLAGRRATTAERLGWLQKRAIACLLVVNVGVLLGMIKLFGAVGGESVDPSQKARLLAEGISEAMNGVAFGLLATPLPLAAAIVIAVRARRLSRRAPSQAA